MNELESLISAAEQMPICPVCRVPDPRSLSECSELLCPALRPGAFVTTRRELWAALVEAVPHGYVTVMNEHGEGRDYYIFNRDLFAAFRAFCDAKESA